MSCAQLNIQKKNTNNIETCRHLPYLYSSNNHLPSFTAWWLHLRRVVSKWWGEMDECMCTYIYICRVRQCARRNILSSSTRFVVWKSEISKRIKWMREKMRALTNRGKNHKRLSKKTCKPLRRDLLMILIILEI